MRLLILSAVIVSCVAAEARAQANVRDSAGVKIRTTTIGKPTGRIRLVEQNALSIGVDGGAKHLEFNRIGHVLHGRNGELIVVDAGSHEVRYFDRNGSFLRKFGRKGEGPGEFHSMRTVGLSLNDTLLVYDDLQRRLTVVSPTGTLVRTFPFATPPKKRTPDYLLSLEDGRIIATAPSMSTAAPRPQPYYFEQHVYVAAADGRIVSDVGTFPMSEHFVQATTKEMGGVAYWNLAFGRNMTIASIGNRLITGDGTGFELKFYSASGRLEDIVRAPEPRQRVEQRDIEAYRARSTSGNQQNNVLAARRVNEMPFPQELPSFSRFLVSKNARLWIQRYPRNGFPDLWVVLDKTGAFIDEVRMPSRFRLFSVTDDLLLGVRRDNDDVEQVYAIPYVMK